MLKWGIKTELTHDWYKLYIKSSVMYYLKSNVVGDSDV